MPESDEAEIVRFIYSEYLAEKSPRAIAAALNEKGVKSMHGCKFDMAVIFSMLENEKYISTVVMQRLGVHFRIYGRGDLRYLHGKARWVQSYGSGRPRRQD